MADFGIALAASRSDGGTRMTETGMSLGTPHYMAPEQAMGEREITPKADIYALGCVLYEMLAGEPPFTGPTPQAIIARVMTEEPRSLTLQRKTIPPHVETAVRTALEKLPADRFGTATQFAEALSGRGPAVPLTRTAAATASAGGGPWRRPFQVAAAVAVAAIGLAAWGWLRGAAHLTPTVVRLALQPEPGTKLALPVAGVATQVALSPDGRYAVYAAGPASGGWRLYLRSFNRLSSSPLAGTEGALNPEFSPDSRWIAFRSSDGKLKKMTVDGGNLTTLCAIDNSGSVGAGITWLTDREIAFARGTYSEGRGLWRVSSEGGNPVLFSQFDSASGERLQLAPRAADHGRLVFYSSTVASNTDLTIGVVRTVSGRPRLFPELRGVRAVGYADGFLVYVRADGALMAAPLDLRSLRAGTPLQVGDSIAVPPSAWDAPVALSASGSLLYQHGGTASQLVRVDLHGATRVLVDSVRAYSHPRLSPDGRSVAVEVQEATGADIWISDPGAHTSERLTHEGYNNRPEWTPDGRRVMYTSSRAPGDALWWQPADGSANATLLFHASNPIREGVFTPDGRSVVYRVDTPDNNRDVYLLPLSGERKPVPLLTSINDEKEPRVSPDSKWLAYVSNESGREEVYVRALSGAGGRVPVSTEGGGEPLWSHDGRRVFYRTGAQLMAATIVTAPSLAVTSREALFEGPYVNDLYHPNYDVALDGRSFVMVRPVEESRQLVTVVNWVQELQRRTGVGR